MMKGKTRQSASDRYVMAMGRKVGNLSAPKTAAKKAAPAAMAKSMKGKGC
jgi:hypothetical protein